MLSILTDRQWLWLAGYFYLAGFLMGTRWLKSGGCPLRTMGYGLLAIGYIFQLIGLYLRGEAVGACPLGNKFEILQFTAWSAISLYLVVGVTFRSSLFGNLTSLLGAFLTLLSLSVQRWDATRRAHLFGGNPWIEFHAALALFSYGVFALLALTSAMFLFRHHSLKSKQPGGWFAFLPSILELDQIGVRLLGFGTALLALSLAIGAVYWLRDTSTANTAKLLVTVAVWAAYGAALLLRARGRLLGKRFAWVCLVLFGFALLSLGPVDASRHGPAESAVPTAGGQP
jgi:ABC-type uncharacterized transport system permease subunit